MKKILLLFLGIICLPVFSQPLNLSDWKQPLMDKSVNNQAYTSILNCEKKTPYYVFYNLLPNNFTSNKERPNAWIALYQERTGKTLQDAQIERILIDIGSYRENLIRIKIQAIAKSNLLNYAPLDILKHIGELVGVPILEAKFSKAKFIFILEVVQDFDIIIPSGTQIESNDGKYIFETLDDAVIKANELSVD